MIFRQVFKCYIGTVGLIGLNGILYDYNCNSNFIKSQKYLSNFDKISMMFELQGKSFLYYSVGFLIWSVINPIYGNSYFSTVDYFKNKYDIVK
jgi:hypothetical protein